MLLPSCGMIAETPRLFPGLGRAEQSYVVQFVYDTWYGGLTPDREFPREIRRVLNTAFGELAERARKSDLKGMLLR